MEGSPTPLGADVLTVLGISADEADVYLALVGRSPTSIDEMRSRGVGGRSLRSVLARLCSAGVVTRTTDDSEMFIANEPTDIFEAQLHDQLLDEHRRASRLAGLERRSHEDDASGPSAATAELIKGESALAALIDRTQRGAKRSVRCVGRLPHQSLAEMHSAHRDLLDRGVECRVVYSLDALRLDAPSLAAIASINADGQRSRILPTTPIGLYLVDDRYALVADGDTTTDSDELRVVRAGPLLDAFAELFECLWNRAMPHELLSVRGEVEELDISETGDRRIVALLLAGLTDAAIARQLGVSPRTVQRRVASMMRKFGVHTRFQLGVQVALEEDKSSSAPQG